MARCCSRFTGPEHHQGYPGRMHGGVITAILDETIGRAIMIRYGEAIWGVTAELNVRFRKPVPLDVELTAVGRITSEDQPAFRGHRRAAPARWLGRGGSRRQVRQAGHRQDRGLRRRTGRVVREAGLEAGRLGRLVD